MMNNYSSRRVVVLGAGGYAGQELLRLLASHPGFQLAAACSSGRAAGPQRLAEIAPGLAGVFRLRGEPEPPCLPISDEAVHEAQAELAFLATPHEVSLEWAPRLLAAGLRVVDLSGAFRFPVPETFERWYGMPHSAREWLAQAVYGWPEKNCGRLPGARLVANPGCYATAALTALWPLIEAQAIEPGGVICDAKSGASGAGKGLREDLHFVELSGNCKAYGLYTHRHTPEIALHAGMETEALTFTPHLLPLRRGLLATSYVRLRPGWDAAAVLDLYQRAYQDAPCVRIHSQGLPDLQMVTRTCFCDLGFRLHPSRPQATIVTCLDNLLKGAASQALENANLMCGYPQAAGLA